MTRPYPITLDGKPAVVEAAHGGYLWVRVSSDEPQGKWPLVRVRETERETNKGS